MRHLARLLPVALLLLAGCNMEQRINAMAPPAMDAHAREYLALLTTGQPDSAYALLTPALQTPEVRAELRRIAGLFAGRSLDSMQRTGVHVRDANGIRHVSLAYQFHDARGWFLGRVETTGDARDVAGGRMVEGVAMQAIPGDLKAIHAFTFRDRGARHYLWIVAMLASLLLSVATALHVGMSRGMPRRWLWVLVALLGLGRFSLDWASGAWSFAPLQFVLGGAAFMRPSAYAPWILSFALPVGAAVAEWKRRAWGRAAVGNQSTRADLGGDAGPVADAGARPL